MMREGQRCVIGFPGEHGAYSEGAALQWRADATTLPLARAAEAVAALQAGRITHAILPMENSLVGTFTPTCRLLSALPPGLHIVGEVQLHEMHCLMALPGTRLLDVEKVQSHSAILEQCETFLTKLGKASAASKDTAGMAKEIAERQLRNVATIAHARAAELYGLHILQHGIEDSKNSVTRFIVVAGTPPTLERHMEPKTTLLLTIKNVTGSLFRAVACFALRDINIAKIESFTSARANPLLSNPWEYMLLLDVDGAVTEGAVAHAIRALEEFATSVHVLGSYPRSFPPLPPPAIGHGNGVIGIGL